MAVAAVVLASRAVAQTPPTTSIRTIDFRNFTYHPKCTEGDVSLRNGRFDSADSSDAVHLFLVTIVYGDLAAHGHLRARIG